MLGCIDELVSLSQVVSQGGLIKDIGDNTVKTGAERLVRLDVGVASLSEKADVGRFAVRAACHVVERAIIAGVEGAGGAVGRDARVARFACVFMKRHRRRSGTASCWRHVWSLCT